MNSNAIPAAVQYPESRRRPAGRPRLFYPVLAALMLLIMIAGFHHYYFEGKAYPGRDIPPPLRSLILVHGTSMSAWMLVFLLQTLMISFRRPRIHMAVGRLAAVLAMAIVVSGLMLSVQATRLSPPDLVRWGLTNRQFMAVPVISILLFGSMVAVGVWQRRRPEIHRPMMLFGTLAALAAATARIDVFGRLYQGTPLEGIFGPTLGVLVIGAVIVAVHWLVTRGFDRWFAAGYAIVLLGYLATMQIARTGAWDRIVGVLIP